MQRRSKRVSLYEHQELAGVGNCKDTDGRVCRELKLQVPIVLSNGNGLCASIRNLRARWWWRLTGYCEFVLGGAPIIIEKSLDVDDVALLSYLRPKGMASPHLDLRVYLGKQTNISTHAQSSECV